MLKTKKEKSKRIRNLIEDKEFIAEADGLISSKLKEKLKTKYKFKSKDKEQVSINIKIKSNATLTASERGLFLECLSKESNKDNCVLRPVAPDNACDNGKAALLWAIIHNKALNKPNRLNTIKLDIDLTETETNDLLGNLDNEDIVLFKQTEDQSFLNLAIANAIASKEEQIKQGMVEFVENKLDISL